MAQIHQCCSRGHEAWSYKGLASCPVVVKGSPCQGEMMSTNTKRAKEILGARARKEN